MFLQSGFNSFGMEVIDGQAFYMMIHCVNSCCCQETCLTQTSSKYLSHASRFLYKWSSAHEHTSCRASEPLIKTNGNAVEQNAIRFGCFIFCNKCIKEPGPIQVKYEFCAIASLPDFNDFIQIITAATSPVRRIFQTDQ